MVEETEASRPSKIEDLPADLTLTREKFMQQFYSEIFGPQAIGNPVAEVTPTEIYGILVAYEDFLKSKGLLNNEHSQATKET